MQKCRCNLRHERLRLPWNGGDPFSKINSWRGRVVGDSGFYWLNYIEPVLETYEEAIAIGLWRCREDVVKSYMERPDYNPWQKSSCSRDRQYPTYPKAWSRQKALNQYWRDYNHKMWKLKSRDRVHCYHTSELNSKAPFEHLPVDIGFSVPRLR